MKRCLIGGLALCLVLGLTGGACAQAQPAPSGAVLVMFEQDEAASAGEAVHFDYIGELRGGAFYGIDPARIQLNGAPLSDDARMRWSEQAEPMALSTDLVAQGQLFQLYAGARHVGNARVEAVDYGYTDASGDDYLSVLLALGQDLPAGLGTLFALQDEVASDGGKLAGADVIVIIDEPEGARRYLLDIDGDGAMEEILWDQSQPALDEENVMHALVISRDGQPLQTLEFFYDNDYTYPAELMFLDINGDGATELILSGTGHNTYLTVYQWRDGAYEATEMGYYSGD